MQRGFSTAYILIGLMVILLISGTYYLKQPKTAEQTSKTSFSTPTSPPHYTITENADTKLYNDSLYSFEITIPKSWYVNPTGGLYNGKLPTVVTFNAQNYDQNDPSNFDKMKFSNKVKNPLRVDIGITTDNTKGLSEVKADLIKDNGQPGGESVLVNIDKITTTTVGGKEALNITYKNKSVRSIFVINNNLFQFDLYYEPTPTNDQQINNILSTFKFTDQK